MDESGNSIRGTDAEFRLLVQAVSDYAIFLLDTEGRIRTWNAGAHKIKGYEAEEVLGQHIRLFYPEDMIARRWPEHELEVARAEGRFEDEGWRLRKDGSRFWASIILTRLDDDEGVFRGFAKVTRDLTDKRRIAMLEDEGRRIATFLAMLGHELRNPLAPIANAVAVMDLVEPDSQNARNAKAVIARQVTQLTRLVDDLLDVGRITSGKIHLKCEPVNLGVALREAVEAADPVARARGHALRLELIDADLWAAADKTRILQVLSNLLGNAVKFTADGGQIVASLARAGDMAALSVKDNGAGVPEHMLKDIFSPFVQGDQDLARAQGGLGLGLSLVHQIVTLHSGQVNVYSAPGRGSEFVVCLPLVQAPSDAPAADTSDARGAGTRILVVDDNEDAANTLRVMLSALGYQASVAYDGPSALEAIRKDLPDVVLLDLGLPGITGIEIATQLREQMAQPPHLVAITGYGQDKDREATTAAGFHSHLTKPVGFPQLLELLRALR